MTDIDERPPALSRRELIITAALVAAFAALLIIHPSALTTTWTWLTNVFSTIATGLITGLRHLLP